MNRLRTVPILRAYPTTVWLDAERTVRLMACPDCFVELHEGGFFRVGSAAGNGRPPGERCDLCHATRGHTGHESWRRRNRVASIDSLHTRAAAQDGEGEEGTE